jgi:hypothetical protein
MPSKTPSSSPELLSSPLFITLGAFVSPIANAFISPSCSPSSKAGLAGALISANGASTTNRPSFRVSATSAFDTRFRRAGSGGGRSERDEVSERAEDFRRGFTAGSGSAGSFSAPSSRGLGVGIEVAGESCPGSLSVDGWGDLGGIGFLFVRFANVAAAGTDHPEVRGFGGPGRGVPGGGSG